MWLSGLAGVSQRAGGVSTCKSEGKVRETAEPLAVIQHDGQLRVPADTAALSQSRTSSWYSE